MRKFHLFLSCIAVVLLFVRCQSDTDLLTTNSFSTKAIVQGNVNYSLGQTFLNNNYIVDNQKSAAGKTIYLDIQSAQYKSGSSGVITYSAVIDSSGNYTFTVPVRAQGSTLATVRMEQFIDNRQVYEKMNANVPVFKSEEVVFTYTKDIALSNGSLAVNNFSYDFNPVGIPSSYNEFITFNGTVNLAFETGFKVGALKGAANKNVEIAVFYPGLNSTLHFGTNVDLNGNYTIRIPVASKSSSITANFAPIGFAANDYIHYSSPTQQKTLNGIYSCSNTETVSTLSGFSEVDNYTVKPMTYYFYPYSIPDSWTDYNLAGWVQLDSRIYKYPVTLSGSIYAAIESSYLNGDYTPVTGKTVSVTIKMGGNYVTQTYILATDNFGNYSLPIMLPSEKMDIQVSVNPDDYGITTFKHYTDNATSIILNGWYQSNYFNISDSTVAINTFSKTYVLDNLYRQFTPENVSNVKNWNWNLIGWYKVSGEKSNIIISGSIKKAIEGVPDIEKPSEWQVANWANAANQPFTIRINNKSLIGITGNTGQYNLSYPINFIPNTNNTSSLTISSIASSIAEVSNFMHYSSIDSFGVPIQGHYSGSAGSVSSNIIDGNCTVEDCYMFFSPTSIPTGWYNYSWTIK